jgi:acyl-CoA hydrolase
MPECIEPESGKSFDRMESGFVVMSRDTNHYGNVHGRVILDGL